MSNLQNLGIIGIIFLIVLVLFIPFIATIVVGIAFANMLGFTGIYWWGFVILFFLIIGAIFAFLNK